MQGWQPYHHPVPLSLNLGTLTSRNPLGPSGPVTGLLYLYLFYSKMNSRPNGAPRSAAFIQGPYSAPTPILKG